MKTNLKKVLKSLKHNDDNNTYNYVVPELWNIFEYQGEEVIKNPNGQIMVNPYKFYADIIENFILVNRNKDVSYLSSISNVNNSFKKNKQKNKTYCGGDWIKKSIVYSTMIRTSTAWDHDRSGMLEDENIYGLKETGTFVKSIALLPLLKKMGVNTLYMLPLSKYSLKDKKGELGSPYGVSSFTELDPNLKDSMTKNDTTVEEEFKAFVEACHILDIRIIIDIIPRTNSVNSDLIATNPEWFYWIKKEDLTEYKPPHVPGVGSTLQPEIEFLPYIYDSEEVLEHINKFIINPKESHPKEWDSMLNYWILDNKKEHILDVINDQLGVTVAPAFSDHINDTQPPWTDITFFRMYLDHPKESKKFLENEGKEVAPYILFDTIKSNMYEGNIINEPLFETLSEIIPSFQRKYGIDGARIDMGHALPTELVNRIITKARNIDPDFCFIAEELKNEKAKASKEKGYNMIIGQGFYKEPRIYDHQTHEFMYDSRFLECPVFASSETHDTPRTAARDGGRTLSKMLSVTNLFMPNGVPFINSGQEFYETQPMNTGLDCRKNEDEMLWEKDPFYKKLALFDRFALHYLNDNYMDLPNTYEQIVSIRNKYINEIIKPDNFYPLTFQEVMTPAIGYGYAVNKNKNGLMIIANTDVYNQQFFKIDYNNLKDAIIKKDNLPFVIYSTHPELETNLNFDFDGTLTMWMHPGEVKILKI